MATFVLIHGALHGGWCWEDVVALLSAAGHEAIAPNLPGLAGDPTPHDRVTLASTADFIAEIVRAQREPVVLVGHSLGGAAISAAAERVPDRLAGLIYVTAILIPAGTSVYAWHDSNKDQRVAIAADDMAALGRLCYNRTDPEKAERAVARLTPQPAGPLIDTLMVTDARYGRVRRAYIACSDDHLVSLNMQRKMQAALPCDPVITLDADHSPFLSKPTELVAALLAVAAKFGALPDHVPEC